MKQSCYITKDKYLHIFNLILDEEPKDLVCPSFKLIFKVVN